MAWVKESIFVKIYQDFLEVKSNWHNSRKEEIVVVEEIIILNQILIVNKIVPNAINSHKTTILPTRTETKEEWRQQKMYSILATRLMNNTNQKAH